MINDSDKNEVLLSSGINQVILNEEKQNQENLKQVISALSDKDILIQKGGFLFSASIDADCLCLGILPYFIEGERAHHYDIDLPVKGKCILYGFINSNKTLAILFKPSVDTYDNGFLPGIIDIFRDNYIRLARFLIENGFDEDFELDFGTKNILETTKLFTKIPATAKELALKTAPFDIKDKTVD